MINRYTQQLKRCTGSGGATATRPSWHRSADAGTYTHTHKDKHTCTFIPCKLWSSSPHVIIPYTHKHPLHMPLPQENPTPPPQLSISAAGLLNWLWSAAFGGALLCALPNWSQWRFSRRTLAPVALCSRARHSVILRGSFTPLPLCVPAVAACVWACVSLLC